MTNGKYDQEKTDWTLLPWRAAEAVVEVRDFGSKKYDGPDSWTVIQEPQRRFRAAAMRHLLADMKGEKLDAESGLTHLAHAACNLMFLLELDRKEKGK